MPLPLVSLLPVIGAGISAGANLITNRQNINYQENTNALQNKRNLELYNMQRADALSDWDRQNQYNSPSQQMQRFKEAGLNPNLIYGQMTNSPTIRSTEAKAPDYVAPQLKGNAAAEAIMAYQNVQQMQLQNKSVEAQIAESQARRQKIESEKIGQDYNNANTILNSPAIQEALHQKVLLNDATLRQMEQNLEQSKKMNPLQQDLAKSQLSTLSQNRYWQALTEAQKNEVAKAQAKLIKAQEDKTIDEADLLKLEFTRLTNFGINRNFLGDLLKIIAAGLIK